MDIAYREDTDIEDRTIDSHVKRIRKKFKKVDENFSAIETRYGVDIDGMLVNVQCFNKKFIYLKKFLFINFVFFIIIRTFTFYI